MGPSRYDLYEWCVQSPVMQARFLRALHGGRDRVLCEDFCGPASIARAWAGLEAANVGIGIDRDAEPLRHARARAREQKIPAKRFAVERADVMRTSRRADIIAAFNFAVCEVHDRAGLVRYLERVRRRLRSDGVFVCDVYGGPNAFEAGTMVQRVQTPVGRAEYTWEQRRADPLTGRAENAMHFRLPGGRVLRDAFEYDWRLWSVVEVREALEEAGFAATEVHLSYGGAIDGAGDPVPRAEAPWPEVEGDFVAYVVGRKKAFTTETRRTQRKTFGLGSRRGRTGR